MVHSTQGVTDGKITREFPLKPSVPPSIKGMILSGLGLPSGLYSTKLT